MRDWLSYQRELWGLRRQRSRISELYAKDVAAAYRDKKPTEAVDDLWGAERLETSMVDEEVLKLETRRLLRMASAYFLPISDSLEDWERCQQTGGQHLSLKAISELRVAIRKERADRRQDWQGALFWLSGLTGIIGVITGLVAVLKK